MNLILFQRFYSFLNWVDFWEKHLGKAGEIFLPLHRFGGCRFFRKWVEVGRSGEKWPNFPPRNNVQTLTKTNQLRRDFFQVPGCEESRHGACKLAE
jgi:hypothetical protein